MIAAHRPTGLISWRDRSEIVPSENFVQIANEMAKMPPARAEWQHTFTRGIDGKSNLYSRRIRMFKGDVWMSKIHLSEHPYVILSGEVLVIREDGTGTHIKAPHFGITEPGTQRLIKVLEETDWITFHATNKTDLDEIESEIILHQDDPRERHAHH